ncbi:MAG TPA: hypothetical protein VG165_08085 [Solirubrobacteraceae bacterium]|jgi:hypothetical protein|nr:hypothetical protein [Solirubrobacteraceae bacterium]
MRILSIALASLAVAVAGTVACSATRVAGPGGPQSSGLAAVGSSGTGVGRLHEHHLQPGAELAEPVAATRRQGGRRRSDRLA